MKTHATLATLLVLAASTAGAQATPKSAPAANQKPTAVATIKPVAPAHIDTGHKTASAATAADSGKAHGAKTRKHRTAKKPSN
jgi:hypothetical protein